MNAVSYNLIAITEAPRNKINSSILMQLDEERQLVEQAKFNTQSFAHLYDIYFHKVYAFVASKVNNRDDAEDITSEVFIKVLEGLHGFEWKGVPFGAWIFRIARNCLIDYYQKSSKRRNTSIEEAYDIHEDEEKASPLKNASREELAEMVKKVMKNLDERELTVVQLKFFSGLSNREIAATLDISESNVGVILFRTLKKIKPDLINFV